MRSSWLRFSAAPGEDHLVRDRVGADELRWAKVESWEDAGHPVIRDTGRELAPGVRPGPLVAIEARFIADWGIWVDGSGVVEAPAPKAPATISRS